MVIEMQKPIIKGGVVVNVIEIDEDTEIVTKEALKLRQAEEAAEYSVANAEWQGVLKKRMAYIKEARDQAFMMQGVVNALRIQVEVEKRTKGKVLSQGKLDEAISEAEITVSIANNLMAEPIPDKPAMKRSKMWFMPSHMEGCIVGPPGGNIGDLWDGTSYSKPPKQPQADTPAERKDAAP